MPNRTFTTKLLAASALTASLAGPAPAAAAPLQVLFVGNSFTYTRPPAMNYNTAAVVDMNYQNYLTKPEGNDPALPQPWGGVPAIVKKLADQAGLEMDIHHSLRGGATLRGHFLNSNPAGWDLRANIAAKRWDIVVLQGNSTEAVNKAGGDFAQFNAYVKLIEGWIHDGTALSYREKDLYGGASNALRNIPANPNANAQALVYLYQTWARPDLVYPAGTPYEGLGLAVMTEDLRAAYASAAASDGRITAVAPVGQAFQRAVDSGVALANPYAPQSNGVNLWWHEDWFHPSGHGAYLSALVMFGTLTGIDPASFGANEAAASDLGIRPPAVQHLQRVASDQLRASGFALKSANCLHAAPRANGNRPCLR